ncbi:la-related protein Larp4B-like [Parasteatoda tepidariorum]|uniref:la-related protein Larp4B-like n=1 Tax=Parasteatoda tepidariorum TaxID=114398 RepID=UPI001C7234BC|nr:histidine-rich glycoprotein-like [Parasteatoda tepidariorum]
MIYQVIILAIISIAAFAHPPLDHGHHAPKPYKFGYSIKDKHGEQHREKSGTGGHVTGSYGFTDDRGIHREVHYVADHGGFRAQVKTNEPGTANQNPAAVHIHSSAPAHGHLYGGYAGHGHAYANHGHGHVAHGHGHVAHGHGHVPHGHGHVAHGHSYAGHGHEGNAGLGYGYGGYGLGYNGLGYGAGFGGYGLASALLGTLPYARYGY